MGPWARGMGPWAMGPCTHGHMGMDPGPGRQLGPGMGRVGGTARQRGAERKAANMQSARARSEAAQFRPVQHIFLQQVGNKVRATRCCSPTHYHI